MSFEEKIESHNAPPVAVPLLFFGVAVAGLLLSLSLGAWRADILAGPWKHTPYTLAVLHLFVLGWGTTLVMGAIYQMAPVVLHGHLYSSGLTRVQLALHALGVTGLAAGFWEWESRLVIAGGTLVVTSICLWVYNTVRTLRSGKLPNWVGYGLWGAAIYLLAVAGWGLTMAVNLRYGFIRSIDSTIAGHLALGAGGWFTLTIAVASFKLLPMFAVSPPAPPAGAKAVVVGLGLAPMGMALSLALVPQTRWLPLVFAAAWSAAAVTYAGLIWRSLLARPRHRVLEPPVRFAGAAAVILGLLAISGWIPGVLATPNRQAAFVYLFLTGWIGTMTLGQLYRILPFVVWLDRFRRRLHNEAIPFLHVMAPRGRSLWILALWLAGTVMGAAGLALGSEWVLRGALLLQLGAALVFTVTAVRVVRYLRREWDQR